jgi:hypothetical protein
MGRVDGFTDPAEGWFAVDQVPDQVTATDWVRTGRRKRNGEGFEMRWFRRVLFHAFL